MRVWMKAALGAGIITTVVGVGCGDTTIENPGGSTATGSTSSSSSSSSSSSGTAGGGGSLPGDATKIDLLFDVDNSRSMADKQQLLEAALPDLVRGIVNPVCVDGDGVPSATQPAGPTDPCPVAGTKRKFAPILDLHIGVITTSLGGHGSDACPADDSYSCGGGVLNVTNNDMGHLVSRLDPCAGGTVSTYQNQGFLAWDPKAAETPPGEAKVGSINVDTTTGAVTTVNPGLVPTLKDLVAGAGQVGCGYESQLESWYRFLIDPDPYQTISFNGSAGKFEPQGVDQILLQQRKDFLRPSSVLAVILLSDENDCSIKEYGQFPYVAQQRDPTNPAKSFHLPRARSECATNPADPCCLSCGQSQGSCPPDPNCGTPVTELEDQATLRCWAQKRRFGIDFLYPIDRYVAGLSASTVPNRMGELVPNPIFSDLDPTDTDSTIRTPADVFFTAIVGVPWQDLAKDPHDLKKGYKESAELALLDTAGHSVWDYVIGNPATYAPPLDPLMIEANAPRSGTNPFLGVALAPPSTAPGPGPNPINGHEFTSKMADDLEYACIFPLWQARDCTVPGLASCDCVDPQNNNPLCEPNPAQGGSRTLQARAKAYPGIRELSLVQALGGQGVAGSVCPAQIDNMNAADFGYRPVVGALVDRMKTRLAQ